VWSSKASDDAFIHLGHGKEQMPSSDHAVWRGHQNACGLLVGDDMDLIKAMEDFLKSPIAVMNGEQLVMLLMEHGIRVHRSTSDLFEIDEEFTAGGTVN